MIDIFFKNLINLKMFEFINGDWGLGIGDWGLGIGPNPQSPKKNFILIFNYLIVNF